MWVLIRGQRPDLALSPKGWVNETVMSQRHCLTPTPCSSGLSHTQPLAVFVALMNESSLCGARRSPLSLICFCAVFAASPTWPTCWAFLSVPQPGSDTLNYFLSCCSQHRCALTSFSPPSALPLNVTFDFFNSDIYIWCLCDVWQNVYFKQVTVLLLCFLDKCKCLIEFNFWKSALLMSWRSLIFVPVWWQHPHPSVNSIVFILFPYYTRSCKNVFNWRLYTASQYAVC